ncbi:MAG: hypothetical protein QM778_21155 [Myxococcales bacterium]
MLDPAHSTRPQAYPGKEASETTRFAWMDRVWRWFESVSELKFGALLALLVVLRSGVHIELDLEWLPQCVAAFPHLSGNFRCHNAIISVLPWLLHVDTAVEWSRLHAALLGGSLFGTLVLAYRFAPGIRFKQLALWLGLSAMPVALLQTRVYYDPYAIFGGSLLALAHGPFAIFAGGLLLGLSHPEMSLVAALSVGSVALALDLVRTRRIKLALVSCVLGAALTKLHGWLDPPAGLDRAGVLGRSVRSALFHATQSGTMGLYACHGLAWLLIVAYLLHARASARQRLWLVTGLVILPGIVTLITLDGTRVFVGTVWPAFVIFVSTLLARSQRGDSPVPIRTLTCVALVMALIAPSYISGGGHVSRPRFGSLAKHSLE